MNNISHVACCGCGACINSCPKHCISLVPNPEGFYQANIDQNKCINCGKCKQSCVMMRNINNKLPIAAFAAYSQNDLIQRTSTSGGVFSHLADVILKEQGVVVGVAFDDQMRVRHFAETSPNSVARMRGSKYVQSWSVDSYEEVRKALALGKKVLFSGTPCQVAALYTFLGGKPEGLVTIDLICHGVASPGLFQAYLDYLEKKYRGKIINYSFRSKEKANSIISYTSKITFEIRGKIKNIFIDGDEDPFAIRFVGNALQNESCYQCPYADEHRMGDITLGDYWGYDHTEQKNNATSVSLVFASTEKGVDLLRRTNQLYLEDTTRGKYIKKNHHLSRPASRSADRNIIYQKYIELGFNNKFYNKYYLPRGYRAYILKRRIRGILK